MPKRASDLRLYLRELSREFISAMSTLFGLIVSAIGWFFIPDAPKLRPYVIGIGVLSMLYASYRLWVIKNNDLVALTGDGLLEARREAVRREWDNFSATQKEVTRRLLLMNRQDIVELATFTFKAGLKVEKGEIDRIKRSCFVEVGTDRLRTWSIRPEFVKALELVVRDSDQADLEAPPTSQ